MNDWSDGGRDEVEDDADTSSDDDLFEQDDDDVTIACPACGAAIYEDADQCPRCGEWITPGAANGGRRLMVTAAVLLMAMLMLVLALC